MDGSARSETDRPRTRYSQAGSARTRHLRAMLTSASCESASQNAQPRPR